MSITRASARTILDRVSMVVMLHRVTVTDEVDFGFLDEGHCDVNLSRGCTSSVLSPSAVTRGSDKLCHVTEHCALWTGYYR
jgi:hypothetical protein